MLKFRRGASRGIRKGATSATCSAVTRVAASGGIQPFEAGATMDDREDPDGDRNGSEQEIGGMSWKPSDRSAHARFTPPRPAPPRPTPECSPNPRMAPFSHKYQHEHKSHARHAWASAFPSRARAAAIAVHGSEPSSATPPLAQRQNHPYWTRGKVQLWSIMTIATLAMVTLVFAGFMFLVPHSNPAPHPFTTRRARKCG